MGKYPGLGRRMGRRQKPKRVNRGVSDSVFVGGYEEAKIDPGPEVAREMSGRPELSHHVVVRERPVRPSLERPVAPVIEKAMHGDGTRPKFARNMARVGARVRKEEAERNG